MLHKWDKGIRINTLLQICEPQAITASDWECETPDSCCGIQCNCAGIRLITHYTVFKRSINSQQTEVLTQLHNFMID